MRTYEFTVILAGIDVMTEEIANDLYESGCADGSPFSGNGLAAVGFDRDAPSLEEAIRSALADVERAGLAAVRVEIGSSELATLRG